MITGYTVEYCEHLVRLDCTKINNSQYLHHSYSVTHGMNGNFLITGAAGGFGREFSRRVLESGGRVVLTDVNPGAGRKLREEYQQVSSYGNTRSSYQSCRKILLRNSSSWR